MNRDTLYFLLFMVGAFFYMVISSRLREWSNRKKKAIDDRNPKSPDRPVSQSPNKAESAERGHTIPEILTRAADSPVTRRKEPPPIPTRSQSYEASAAEQIARQYGQKAIRTFSRPSESASLTRIRKALQHPKSVRDAVLLSEILRPPKALNFER
jgi:hypothetical protein